MNVLRYAVLALLSSTLPLAAQDAQRFENAGAGFAMTKPAGWRFVSSGEVAASRANTRFNDEEMQAYLEQRASAPLVAMIKEQPAAAGVNPNLQVGLRPLAPPLRTLTPKQIVEVIIPTMKKQFPDFTLEGPIRELELGGRRAAEYVATYTLQTKAPTDKGTTFPVRGRTIFVPRGKFLFLIGMVAPAGDEGAKAEFEKILATITIAE